jgi:hypothetical protein
LKQGFNSRFNQFWYNTPGGVEIFLTDKRLALQNKQQDGTSGNE